MKTLIKFIVMLILNLCFIYQNALSSDKIKIGLIVPLSGEYSELGNSIVKSTRMAINKIDELEMEESTLQYYELGLPFLAKLGKIIYNYELKREKAVSPDFSRYLLKY